MEEQRRWGHGPMRVGSVAPALRRLFVGQGRGLAVTVVASLLGGFAQAAVLVSLVNVGVGLAAGDDTLTASLGPVGGIEAGTGTLLLVALGFLAAVVILELVAAYVSARISVAVMARERVHAYRTYANASWSVQAAEADGHLQELLSKNAGWTGTAMNSALGGAVAACTLLALAVSAILVEPLVALALVSAVALLAGGVRPLLRAVRRRTEVLSGLNVAFANTIARNVGLAQDIRTHDVGDEVRAQVDAEIHELSRRWLAIRFLNRVSPVLFRNAALLLLILAVGVVHLSGRDDLAAMGAVVVIVLRALGSAGSVQRSLQELHNAVPWLDQLWTRVAHFEANQVSSGERSLPAIRALRFCDVGFAYEGEERPPVLRHVDFEVAVGEAIGIVGPSGAGKSTLVKLLLRLHEPTDGSILVDGHPAAAYDLADWYRRVAFVPQHIVTFNGTIRDNIAFFRPWVTDAAVEAAARRAHLHREITALPDGYATVVGERVGRLSGGQRQRLALARALVSDPDVLVLDEPTSALDMASESLVQQTLEELRGSTTLFIVAHRLSTLATCERILVLEEGTVAGLDTPERLRADNDFFREATRLARL